MNNNIRQSLDSWIYLLCSKGMNKEADQLEKLVNEFMNKSHCLYQVNSIINLFNIYE